VGDVLLEVREFTSLAQWRWVLTDSSGKFIADHAVLLDEKCWQFEAFTDLQGYVSWRSAPDRYAEDEARIVGEVGAWIGAEVLGPVVQALVRMRPVTARVTVTAEAPREAKALLLRPLELAHANGRPLSAQDVTLVMDPGDVGFGGPAAPVGERLRVLGLFSMPEGGQPLNIRRERHTLVQLVHRITAGGKAADVRVLQYGVTRERLQDVLEEAEGWDIIHISGHGAPGELLLETAAGTPDLVSAADLAEMLDLARERVKLVTVSACWSAALAAHSERKLLGLLIQDNRTGGPGSDAEEDHGAVSGTLATELTRQLRCAVLAMRYPVDDEFAIALSGKLYTLLADKGQPLPRAFGIALRQLASGLHGRKFPALSIAAPALFGESATGLRLAAPERYGPENYDTIRLKMSGFPPHPERFVGRTGVMARASAALAAQSGVPGVLLHGMPGGGKTACALELAHGHEHAFDRLVWYKAPDEGLAINGALSDFALTLERDLPGFQMAHLLADETKLAGFAPKLTELAERRRVLIVIDNIESLLSDNGEWRDKRWETTVTALCAHRGLGRVVLTSRRLPARWQGAKASLAGLRTEAVDALSLDEALLLARELPHLRKLIYDDLPGMDRELSRRLALGVLNVAQGHPKLLELADGQAADPDRLALLVETGASAWREQGGLPDGFFTTGETTAATGDYLHVLATWSRAITETLTPGERTLFWFLCCLEEPDRTQDIIGGTWAVLWQMLGMDGQAPHPDQLLSRITAYGLATIQNQVGDMYESYAIHPGITSAGRAQSGKKFQDAVDAVAATWWDAIFRNASGEADVEIINTSLMVRAGLAAIPYLMRRGQWTHAGLMLDRAFAYDPSRANAAAALPAIEEIVRHDPSQAGLLAAIEAAIDPGAAETAFRTRLDAAVARGDYLEASQSAGVLVDLYCDSGRLAEALMIAEQKTGYAIRAGLGPWTQLNNQIRRLQVLNAMGEAEQVLAEVQLLHEHMTTLPSPPGTNEHVAPDGVLELLIDTGRFACVLLRQWDAALGLNSVVVSSMADRSAPTAEIAAALLNDYGPLLELDRTSQALALLQECRKVFEEVHDIKMLGRVFAALAATEDQRNHGEAAIHMQRDALRYGYLAGDVHPIATGYHNLGNYLAVHARQPSEALASHLIASLICVLADIGIGVDSIRGAAEDLRRHGTDDALPGSVTELCGQIGEIPGADPARLVSELSPNPETAEQALQQVIMQARTLADAPSDNEKAT
jgi:tetratricopeptide (TPR) repeat protein